MGHDDVRRHAGPHSTLEDDIAERSSPPRDLSPAVRVLSLPRRRDERGTLLPIEAPDLPFTPKRVFFVRDVPVGTRRGGHAHATGTQLLVCLGGAIEVEVRHEGVGDIILLDEPSTGLLLGPRVWAAQTYLETATILMVLCDDRYDPDDVIREPTKDG